MKIYFLSIPVIIGILIGVGLISNLEQTSDNPSGLNEENLIQGSTMMGDPNAKITVVEFGDYQCTFCYKFHDETMEKIKEKYIKTGNVNFVYKDFPLNGKQSILASEASYCAQKQNKFWEYHDTLYNNWGGENTGWITENVLLGFARDIKLDLDEFSQCLKNSEFRQKVIDNEQFGKEIGINATPSFLIFNDNEAYRIIGAQPFEKFEQVFKKLGNS
ncbi:MAG: thioredoxin domain-containing protein [Crenarchaeota archaeon]|nr:thioredoxin domain-containing protein [Thermoproteota archaeon]MDA1124909.1 thioredoxin domain-containing protein [Thermoproteota archaeon]